MFRGWGEHAIIWRIVPPGSGLGHPAYVDKDNKVSKRKQGSIGIRHWPLKKCTSLIMIHNITLFVDYNSMVETFGHAT